MRSFVLTAPLLAALLLATPSPVVASEQADTRHHLLIANDDGVDAPGLRALVEVLAADARYRLTVVAPAEPQSGKGHSLVLRQAIQVSPHEPLAADCPTWAVFATPATTVNLAVTTLLADDPPDLVLSGINRGENPGRIAWYSGTVAAAREASLNGFTAIALSLQLDWDNPKPDYQAAARWAKPVVDAVIKHELPAGLLLNVNIPRETGSINGYRVTTGGMAPDSESSWRLTLEEQGTRWYEVARWRPPLDDLPATDNHSLQRGWVVITPLSLDQTAVTALPFLLELQPTPPPPPAVPTPPVQTPPQHDP